MKREKIHCKVEYFDLNSLVIVTEKMTIDEARNTRSPCFYAVFYYTSYPFHRSNDVKEIFHLI